MKRLESMGAIAIKPDTHFSIVTIVNWGIYQGKGGKNGHPTGHPKDRQGTRKGQARNTYKKGKKGRGGQNGEKGESRRGDHRSNGGGWGEAEEATRRLATEVSNTVRVKPDNRTRDRSLILKACYLVAAGIMPEVWLRDAVEAVKQGKHKKNTAAYFHCCLTEGAENRGKSLPKLLATACTKIPADVLAGKSAHRAADDRLGAVHVDGDPTDSPAHQDRAPCVPEGLDDPKHLPHGKPAK